MIKKKDDINREYLYYLMNDLGLFNDYELHEIGISFDDLDNPDDVTIGKLEDYLDKKRD